MWFDYANQAREKIMPTLNVSVADNLLIQTHPCNTILNFIGQTRRTPLESFLGQVTHARIMESLSLSDFFIKFIPIQTSQENRRISTKTYESLSTLDVYTWLTVGGQGEKATETPKRSGNLESKTINVDPIVIGDRKEFGCCGDGLKLVNWQGVGAAAAVVAAEFLSNANEYLHLRSSL